MKECITSPGKKNVCEGEGEKGKQSS